MFKILVTNSLFTQIYIMNSVGDELLFALQPLFHRKAVSPALIRLYFNGKWVNAYPWFHSLRPSRPGTTMYIELTYTDSFHIGLVSRKSNSDGFLPELFHYEIDS